MASRAGAKLEKRLCISNNSKNSEKYFELKSKNIWHWRMSAAHVHKMFGLFGWAENADQLLLLKI